LADSYGKGQEAKQILMEKTYEEGFNISNIEVLSTVAEELGLPRATEYLVSFLKINSILFVYFLLRSFV
jgi:hypothetical protein